MGCLLDMKLTARFEPWGYIHDLSWNICKRLQGKNTLKGITTMISASTNNGQKINEYQD